MAEIQALRAQEYSDNLIMLSQQKMAKLANFCTKQNVSGAKAVRMMSQIDSTQMVERTTSAKPAINIDIDHDGRWVYQQKFDWGKVVDDIDLLQTNITPQGMYVQSAIAAANRKQDDLFVDSFFGTAKTGETGATSTVFDTNNVVAAGGAGLTAAKIYEVREGLLANDVDVDMETIYMAISPKQQTDMFSITQVTSSDYNDTRVLPRGVVASFAGINFVISNRLTVDGSSDRRCPVWVPSGMGCGSWQAVQGTIRTRPDLQGDPDYVEATMMEGYTRLEEAKCFEVKCVE